MPSKYIGEWTDGKTTLTWGKMFEMKESLADRLNFNKEQIQALSLYVKELGIVFFGHTWESDLDNNDIIKWREYDETEEENKGLNKKQVQEMWDQMPEEGRKLLRNMFPDHAITFDNGKSYDLPIKKVEHKRRK